MQKVLKENKTGVSGEKVLKIWLFSGMLKLQRKSACRKDVHVGLR